MVHGHFGHAGHPTAKESWKICGIGFLNARSGTAIGAFSAWVAYLRGPGNPQVSLTHLHHCVELMRLKFSNVRSIVTLGSPLGQSLFLVFFQKVAKQRGYERN